MKKKIFTMLAVVMVGAGVMLGCSKNPQQTVETSTESPLQSEELQEDVSEVNGTMDEIKDFMFIVTDDDNVSYAFSFEKKPEGLDEVAVGDKVIVKYTGTISEVDPFKGEILLVEKQP